MISRSTVRSRWRSRWTIFTSEAYGPAACTPAACISCRAVSVDVCGLHPVPCTLYPGAVSVDVYALAGSMLPPLPILPVLPGEICPRSVEAEIAPRSSRGEDCGDGGCGSGGSGSGGALAAATCVARGERVDKSGGR